MSFASGSIRARTHRKDSVLELIFAVFKYVLTGFFGLIALLFVAALVFGKRIRKRWELEAEFHDAGGRAGVRRR